MQQLKKKDTQFASTWKLFSLDNNSSFYFIAIVWFLRVFITDWLL